MPRECERQHVLNLEDVVTRVSFDCDVRTPNLFAGTETEHTECDNRADTRPTLNLIQAFDRHTVYNRPGQELPRPPCTAPYVVDDGTFESGFRCSRTTS